VGEPGTLIAEVHEHAPPRIVREWYACWASGGLPWEIAEEFGGRVADVRRHNGPIAEALFDLSIMRHSLRFDGYARKVKDWAYITAADFVASRRGPARFSGYALEWGRQAARDGLYRALWPEMECPGRLVRSRQFGIGERPYARVRDHVRSEACGLMSDFEADLSKLHGFT
jgi:hypothetical protein